MRKAYWVTTYREIKDPAKLAAYAKLAPVALAPFGVRYLCRGNPNATYESGLKERLVVSEFPSLDKAIASERTLRPRWRKGLYAINRTVCASRAAGAGDAERARRGLDSRGVERGDGGGQLLEVIVGQPEAGDLLVAGRESHVFVPAVADLASNDPCRTVRQGESGLLGSRLGISEALELSLPVDEETTENPQLGPEPQDVELLDRARLYLRREEHVRLRVVA